MSSPLVLASGSGIRATLLRNAGLTFDVEVPRVDESAVRDSLLEEGALPRDIADALADLKAAKVAARRPGALVIGCDQVLVHDGEILSKPETPDEALDQLRLLSGRSHTLLSAAVVHDEGGAVWRHVGEARLTMRRPSEDWLEAYVARNWESIRHSVGGYKLEEEGVQLFTQVRGDHFTILGIPLLELLSWLMLRGTLPS
ncbi:Maf family protein [Histidinibacterium lentulum]|uniref:Nucleoside triphosphate pyrophosphatase n=1 Tax=Histidinibacterium lentulum TaxID=2480588 RepID=A0A3N2R705_9RHOB|nr:Maf family protein [Histidinibacterium lentulum]ROU03161.1 septum formation protein Maf [Histidinibacterium lentulum]